jgi:prepilin-type processing-associated H-X9-DG protein
VRKGKAITDYPVSESISGDAQAAMNVPTSPAAAYQGFFITAGTPTRTAQVTDGLSNTWMVFEDAGRPDLWEKGKKVSSAGIYTAGNERWADPESRITIQVWCGTPINCNNGNEIYSFHTQGANFLMGDGAVKFFRESLPAQTFVALYTRAGGEVAGGDW